MSPVSTLVGFGLRQVIGKGVEQVIGEGVENVVKAVKQHFRDHGQALPRALASASDRAWRTLGVALAGDGFCDQVRRLFTSGDNKAFRQQVARFLNSGRLGLEDTPVQFRQQCLGELRALRRSGLLSAERLDVALVVERAGQFARYGNRPALVAGAWEAVHAVADALADDYPNLARLLRQPATGEPPLLVSAFTFFFRREVETNPELARGLTWDSLRQLSAAQEAAFAEVERALAVLGERFDEVLEGLGRIEQVAVATHGAVLDLRAEWQRLSGLHQAGADELRRLMEEALARLVRLGMQTCEVRPQHSFSIRGEDERAAVKLLLTRFRQLPAERQQNVPALLNALGKLQVGAGEFADARRTFLEVVKVVGDPAGKAEGSFNAYRAALEEGKWEEGLQAIREAASLDAGRFRPFPLHRYEPRRILGAGGFGTAFLCRDHHFEEDVVVKALYAADLERSPDDVFREARVLRRLSHRAIIGIRDCDYADPSVRARPYLVMDYFPGVTLGQFVAQRGTLTPEQLLAVAVPIAAGMREAHAHGILHRDLKPENVLVRKEGDRWQVKVIDFGLALQKQVIETSVGRGSGKRTVLGRATAGTVLYAPPEQLGRLPGVKVGRYSDVYAFGKTCCYALFRTTEPKRRQWSTLPEELADMLERCTEQALEHRHADFDPVLKVLESLDRQSQQRRREESARGPATEERQRREPGEAEGGQVTKQQTPEKSAPHPPSRVLNTAQEYLERAEAHRRRGDYDRAIADASEAVRVDPGNASAYGLRAVTYLRKKEFGLAIADAWEAIRLDPKGARAYGIRAEAYHNTGDLDRAIADCTKAVRLDPKDAGAYCIRAEAYTRKKDFDLAIADAAEAVRLDPKSASAHSARAEAYRKKGDYDRAIADASQAIRLDPKGARAYCLRAEAYRKKGDYDRAIADASQAIRLDPKDAGAYCLRAEAYQGKGNLDCAIADCTEAIRLEPGDALGHAMRAGVYVRKGNLDCAIADLSEQIRIIPKAAHAHSVLAAAHSARATLYQSRGDYDLAIADASEAIRLDPKGARAHRVRAEAYLCKREIDLTIADASEAIRLDPKGARAHRVRAEAYLCKREIDLTIADASEAIRLDPRDARAYRARAEAYLSKRDYDRAIADATEVVRLAPRDARGYGLRAAAHLWKGELSLAIRGADHAIRIDPRDAFAYAIRAAAHHNKGDYSCAVADYTEAIRLDPGDAMAYRWRAAAYQKGGDFDRAIADASEAIRLDPNCAFDYSTRAAAYQGKGDYDRAIADASQAIRLDPRDARAYRWRGQAYQGKGDLDGTIADCTEAIRLDPGDARAYGTRGYASRQKGDFNRAISDLTEAVRIDPSNQFWKDQLEIAKRAFRQQAARDR